jgi:hypothetical protein
MCSCWTTNPRWRLVQRSSRSPMVAGRGITSGWIAARREVRGGGRRVRPVLWRGVVRRKAWDRCVRPERGRMSVSGTRYYLTSHCPNHDDAAIQNVYEQYRPSKPSSHQTESSRVSSRPILLVRCSPGPAPGILVGSPPLALLPLGGNGAMPIAYASTTAPAQFSRLHVCSSDLAESTPPACQGSFQHNTQLDWNSYPNHNHPTGITNN